MRLVLALLLSFSISLVVNAQVFNEDFEGGSLTANNAWTIQDIVGSYPWYYDNYNGDNFAEVNSYSGGAQNAESWLISPSIDLSSTSSPMLSFQTAANFDGLDIEVYVSTTYAGGAINMADWTELTGFNLSTANNYDEVASGDIDLSVHKSANTYVAFRYISNTTDGSRLWQLDDIQIVSTGATKLGFSQIPTGCILENTATTFEVCALDNDDNIDASFSGDITLSKSSGTGNISGTTTVAAVNGCATFSDIEFDAADTYTVSATSSGLASATSSSFDVKATCNLKDTLVVMSYNLLNFPNGRDDCGTNLTITNRVDTLKKIINYVKPDILMVCELQDETGADLILNNALNVDGITYYQRADFVPNQSSGFTGLNNMFFYNSEKVSLRSQDEILTGTRDVGEYIVYGNDPYLSTSNDTTFIDFYTTHLKAGSTTGDETDRDAEASDIMTHIDAKPSGRNNIIGGDFNFKRASEPGYQTLTTGATYPFNDPISSEGDWNNNSAFAAVHTQSTRSSESIECGATGGNDDRFDLLLVSDNVLSGTDRVSYVPNTYTALGNNGTTFNKDINDATNTSSVPTTILSALYYMSDHLPVVMEVAIEYPSSANLPVPDVADLPDVTAECEVTSLTMPTATDKDNNTINGVADVSLPITSQGTTVVTWTYEDADGYSVTQTQNVIIEDVTAPVPDASSLSDVNADCEVESVTPPAATDNCDGSLTATTTTTFPITDEGITVVTWTYTDAAGNTSTQTQNVNITCASVSVEEIASENLQVFPNPAKDYLMIQFESQELQQIRILSLKGELVYTTNQIKSNSQLNIDVQNWASGIYLVQGVKANKAVFSKKILVE